MTNLPTLWTMGPMAVPGSRSYGMAALDAAVSAVIVGTAHAFYMIGARLPDRGRITKAFVVNGTVASGNICLGIYDRRGTRVLTTGSVAQAGTNDMQVIDVTDVTLEAGDYYLALQADNTSATAMSVSASNNRPYVSLDAVSPGASPLPATVSAFVTGNTSSVFWYGFLLAPRTVI